MLLTTLLIAATLGGAELAADAEPDTFEIVRVNHGMPSGAHVVRLEADAIDFIQWNTIVLRRGSEAVAIVQSNQIAIAINRTAGGENAFEIVPHQGAPIEFRADRMEPQQNNVVLFYTGDRLVGIATQNGAVMIIDKSAKIGPS